jgi:FtsP/CotA-like multicopper oxidase with cupredoxin domain
MATAVEGCGCRRRLLPFAVRLPTLDLDQRLMHLSPEARTKTIHGPGDYDHGPKDTIDLRPAEQAEIIVRFDDYAGRYVLHCHNLEHEDMAMMATFTTTTTSDDR